MFINETITATLDAIRANRARAEQLNRIIREPWSPAYEAIEARKADYKQRQERCTRAAEELQVLEIETKIMHDNARRMIYDATLPAALDILRKYNGKPYGEKTSEKISAEMKQRTGCALYLRNRYDLGMLSIVPLGDDGYTANAFKYDDFNVYVKHTNEGEQRKILNDNKINGTLTPDDFTLSMCPAIVPDPHAHAVRIISEFQRIRQQYSEFEAELSQFNNLLPSQMDRRSVRDFRNYL